MKKSLLRTKDAAPSQKVQEIQTVALIVLGATVVVMACTIAVLLAQVEGHRQSIERLDQKMTSLPTTE